MGRDVEPGQYPTGPRAKASLNSGEAPTLSPADGAGTVGRVTTARSSGPLGAAPKDPLVQLGGTLGRYVVLDVLGTGATGTVLRAFDRELDRPVALKMLHDHVGGHHITRLKREAQAMAKLSHPNVVQVYEVGEIEGRTFVAMELVRGQTPAEWMRGEPRPDWRACVRMFIQLGEGLAAAHAVGLVHRDFKPGNAIIDDEGRPRVLDFGLARRGDERDDAPPGGLDRARTDQIQAGPLDQSLTKTGTVLGTPAYMPPEQMMGEEADARSDQFSFCVSLYEALYGERPFRGSSFATLMAAVTSGQIQPAPKGSHVSTALRTVLLRGLAARPEQRWSSMNELLARLRTLVAPRARRWVARAGLALAAVAGAVALQQSGVVSEQEERLTEKERQLQGKVEELEQEQRRTKIQLAAQTGMRATMAASLDGRELEAVRVAVEALDDIDIQAGPIPVPVFEGLTHALTGIDRGIALRGHEDHVLSVAVSPDGRRIATASTDATVRLWDARSGAPAQTLEGHRGAVRAVAWAPDGRRIATACDDGKARVWDAEAGTELRSFSHPGPVRDVAVSPDGQTIATASGDVAWVWHGGPDALVVPLVGHTGRVRSVAWSPDGARVVTASEDRSVRGWEARAGVSVLSLEGHTDRVLDVAVSPDGTRIATASRDETVRLWDVDTGRQTTALHHGKAVFAVAFSPDSTRLATGTFDDGVARVWDVASGHRIDSLRHRDAVVAVAFSPEGHQLVTASWDRTARSWTLDRSGALLALPHPRRVDAVALSPDGTRIATGSGDGMVRVWNAESGAPTATLHGHRIDVLAVAFSPDSSRLASASWDGTVRAWDLATRQSLVRIEGHTDPVRAVVWSSDGTQLATASRDGTARTWDAATGEPLRSFSHGSPLVDAVFDPEGRRLLTVGTDDVVRAWSVDSGEARSDVVHQGPVTAVAFSRDGTRLAVATKDHGVHLRHADSGEAVASVPGLSAAVRSMAFSPDDAYLAVAGEDGTAGVWDLATHAPLARFPHADPVLDVAWSTNGQMLATASGDAYARLWALDPRDWLAWGCAVLEGREAHGEATTRACSRVPPEARRGKPPSPRAEPPLTTAADTEAPEVITVRGVELVLIPGGTFTMGSPPGERGRWDREGPQHEVTLDSFYLARTELTNAQYARFLEVHPDAKTLSAWKYDRYDQPDQPVVGLTWHEAKAYCDWAGLVLPTEAQWEYAARAGTTTSYWFGDDPKDLDRFDWYLDNTEGGATLGRPHAVGSKAANPFGLYDMHGNMREWVLDVHGDYTSSPRAVDGLRYAPQGEEYRVIRGGSWGFPLRFARSASRGVSVPDYRHSAIGFRPALGGSGRGSGDSPEESRRRPHR